MSLNKQSWVVATITTFVMMLAALVSTPAASAAPGDPIIPSSPTCIVTLTSGDPATAPPAPTCYDPSGSDLDELLVPVYYDASGYDVSYVNSNMGPYKTASPNSTNGASQVLVQTMRFDPSVGGYVKAHAWQLTFNTSVTATPSPNGYAVSVGSCVNSNTRQVTASFRNEAGPDGRYIGYVFPQAYATGVTVLDTQPASRVYDGATVSIPLVYIAEDGNGIAGGYTYTVDFWLTDTSSVPGSGAGTRRLGGSVKVYVPSCKEGTVPPSTSTTKPQAKIVVLKRGPVFNKVRVVLGSRKATEPTAYKVIRDPRKGKTLRKTYDTKFKKVTYYKIRKGTVIKVRFQTKVLRRRI